jgi:hypothetical protein
VVRVEGAGSPEMGDMSVILLYVQHGEKQTGKEGEDARARHAVTASTSALSRLVEVGPRAFANCERAQPRRL